MASRTNKYASLNFNDIYEKKTINPSNNRSHASSSSSFPSSFSGGGGKNKTVLSNSRIHGNMLVLTRPPPKPTVPQLPPPSQTLPSPLPFVPSFQDPIPLESDSISLRPLGRTGTGPDPGSSPVVSPLIPQKLDKDLTPPLSSSPKTNRFVPPHLRPGFAGREEKQQPEIQQQKQQIGRTRENGGQRQGYYGSEGRPKSGGGYERMLGGNETGLVEMKRPGSSGTRPTSSSG